MRSRGGVTPIAMRLASGTKPVRCGMSLSRAAGEPARTTWLATWLAGPSGGEATPGGRFWRVAAGLRGGGRAGPGKDPAAGEKLGFIHGPRVVLDGPGR